MESDKFRLTPTRLVVTPNATTVLNILEGLNAVVERCGNLPLQRLQTFPPRGKRGFGIEKAGSDGAGEFWILFGVSMKVG
jgi:hypothetical protein